MTHPIDVVSVVLPMLRPLRTLRVFTAGQVLVSRGAGPARSGTGAGMSAGLLILVGALAVLDAERGKFEGRRTRATARTRWAARVATADASDPAGVPTLLAIPPSGWRGSGHSLVTEVLGDEVTSASCPSSGPRRC